MKKILFLTIAFTLTLSLVSCGDQKKGNAEATATEEVNNEAEEALKAYEAWADKQEELAEKAGLCREYIARVETGVKRISLKKLFEIADILNVACSDLINFK